MKSKYMRTGGSTTIEDLEIFFDCCDGPCNCLCTGSQLIEKPRTGKFVTELPWSGVVCTGKVFFADTLVQTEVQGRKSVYH